VSFFYINDAGTPAGQGGEDVALLVAGGEIDYAVSSRLRERIDERIDTGARHLILDLSTVTFLDSTAIGVLVGAVMRLRELGGGSLSVVCADENERILGIFEIAGVDSLIALHRSREDALSSLAGAR
jgi:anti-sigma B factor antagonist